MSTSYGYHCRTCHVSSPHWLNHGDQVLIWLYVHRAEIMPAWRLGQENNEPGAGYLEGPTVMACYDDPQPLAFLNQHGGHDLVLEDEYRRTYPLVTSANGLPFKPDPSSELGC